MCHLSLAPATCFVFEMAVLADRTLSSCQRLADYAMMIVNLNHVHTFSLVVDTATWI
jgi:hypothetical protein